MQRQLSIISGSEQPVVMQQAQTLFKDIPQLLWITQHSIPVNESSVCIPASKARTVLGREFYLVIFDAWSGLDVNALAAVVGTIRAGGVLVLLTPPLQDWHTYPDPNYRKFLPHPWHPEQINGHFLQRFVRMLEKCALSPVESISDSAPFFITKTTSDQKAALEVILQADSPVVLNADRGRGKSAVLGMAAQRFKDSGQRVVLTAPSRATVETVFKHADSAIEFYAPDDFLQRLPEADVLMVDEAAAIPLPMLIKMLQCYPRCIFSTTLQGYEGSGRGFVLRFQTMLDEVAPDWRDVKLATPIRWGVDDWLEGFVDRWLVMDGEMGEQGRLSPFLSCGGCRKSQIPLVPPKPRLQNKTCESKGEALPAKPRAKPIKLPSFGKGGAGGGFSVPFTTPPQGRKGAKISKQGLQNNVQHKLLPQSHLATNEPKLREIFNLLINAHYQTRPSDLRQILDAPQISIHTLEWQQQIVAVALLSSEGGLERELVANIHAGKRRPHGHLLAQSLTFHAGIEGAACLKCERIMRIAVHADFQRQGIGHYLLDKLRDYAVRQQADYLGVSYALSPGLLAFWVKAGFASVRLGFRKDTASGSRSLMQIQGLSDEGIDLVHHAQGTFQAGLPDWLEKLGDVPEALVDELLITNRSG